MKKINLYLIRVTLLIVLLAGVATAASASTSDIVAGYYDTTVTVTGKSTDAQLIVEIWNSEGAMVGVSNATTRNGAFVATISTGVLANNTYRVKVVNAAGGNYQESSVAVSVAVSNLSVSYQNPQVTVNGQASSERVLVQIWNASEEMVGVGNALVTNGSFSLVIEAGQLPSGSYKVKALNVNGGTYTQKSFDVASTTGGGSSNSSTVTSTATPTPTATPSPTATPAPTTTPILPSVAFKDLGEVTWAQEGIVALSQAGIISGRDAEHFDPQNTITRAEFVKLTVLVFGFSGESNVLFEDVTQKDWFYPYIKTAVAKGFVQGVSTKSFEPHTKINREQATTMLYRAAQIKGLKLPDAEKTEEFSDPISDWAKQAIIALQKAGILKGKGNNQFMSFDNMTRAEAAKVVYQMYKLLK